MTDTTVTPVHIVDVRIMRAADEDAWLMHIVEDPTFHSFARTVDEVYEHAQDLADLFIAERGLDGLAFARHVDGD